MVPINGYNHITLINNSRREFIVRTFMTEVCLKNYRVSGDQVAKPLSSLDIFKIKYKKKAKEGFRTRVVNCGGFTLNIFSYFYSYPV